MKRLLSLVLLLSACDADVGDTTLRVTAWGEDFIEEGIPAETFSDGWRVEFESFAVTISGVDADGEALDGAFTVDLAEASDGTGHELGSLEVPASGTPLVSWTVETFEVRGSATKGEVSKTFDWSFEPRPQVRVKNIDPTLRPQAGTMAALWAAVGQHVSMDEVFPAVTDPKFCSSYRDPSGVDSLIYGAGRLHTRQRPAAHAPRGSSPGLDF